MPLSVSVSHIKTVTIADGVDTTVVRPSDWNSSHTVTASISLATSEALAISAGASSQLTGIVTFSNSNGVSFGLNAGTMTASVAPPSGGTSTYDAVGNTTGSTTSASLASSLTISGAGGVSVGFSNSSLIVSGATTVASQGGLTIDATGNTAGSTTSVSTSLPATLTFSGSGIASVGMSNSSIVVNVPAPAASQGGLSFDATGGTAGSTTSMSTSLPATLTFSGSGNASVGFSGNTIVVSAATTSVALTQTLVAVGGTAGSTTSETIGSAITFSGSNNASVGFSGGTVVVSVPTPAASATSMGLTATGVTAGSTTSMSQAITAQTLSGGGMAGVGFSGGTIIVSVPAAGQMLAIGGTAGSTTSQTTAITALTFSGSNNASVGFSGGTVVISVPTPAASATSYSGSISGNTTAVVSTTTLPFNPEIISGAGAISVGYSTTTTATSATATLVISAPVPIASATSYSGNASGNTTAVVSATTVPFTPYIISGAGIASIGYSTTTTATSGTATLVISASSAASQGGLSLNALGGTAGSTTSMSTSLPATLSFSGSGNASVGFSGNTIVLSAATVASATSMGQSVVGNTAGSTTSQTRAITAETISGAGIASVGFSGGTIVVSAASAVITQSLLASSQTTAAASSASITGSQITFVGSNGISVGFSNSSLVIADALASFYEPFVLQTTGLAVTLINASGTNNVSAMPVIVPNAISFNQIRHIGSLTASYSSATTATGSFSTSFSNGYSRTLGFYTVGTAGTSIGSSITTSYSFGLTQSITGTVGSSTVSLTWNYPAGTAGTSSFSTSTSTLGAVSTLPAATSGFINSRRVDVGWTTSLPPGFYVFAIQYSQATTNVAFFESAWVGGPSYNGPVSSIGTTVVLDPVPWFGSFATSTTLSSFGLTSFTNTIQRAYFNLVNALTSL